MNKASMKWGKVRGISGAKKLILSIGLLFPLLASSAWGMGEQVADYTAYPPFLPRVVSPNILFLLDYSDSMIRPAYGSCTPISSNETTITSANCANSNNTACLSNCRTTFLHLAGDDYDSTTPYTGYFDNGYTSSPYSDSSAYKYSCTGTSCQKNAGSSWNGNWLNWLTTTQFDVLKKVTVGGDMDPAPEGATSPTKLWSRLGASPGVSIYKSVKYSNASNNNYDYAGYTFAQLLPYKWIDTPATATTIFGGGVDPNDVHYEGRSVSLPFDLKLDNQTVPAGTNFTLYPYGFMYWQNTSGTSYVALYDYFFDRNNYNVLYVDKSDGSTIKKFMIGSAPNRIFVISFENMRSDSNLGVLAPFNFQMLFFESGEVVFQNKDVQPSQSYGGTGYIYSASVKDGVGWGKYHSLGDTALSNLRSVFITPGHTLYKVTPGTPTTFGVAESPFAVTYGWGARPTYNDQITVNTIAKVSGSCPSGYYLNSDQEKRGNNPCIDHPSTGLIQDFRDGEMAGTLGFRIGIMQLKDDTASGSAYGGGKVVKHFNEKDDTSWSNLMTTIRGGLPTKNTPLAEALYEAQGYFRRDASYLMATGDWLDGTAKCMSSDTDNNNFDPYCFQSAAQRVGCCKNFALVVSSGNYSKDKGENIYGDAGPNAETFTWSNNAWLTTTDEAAAGTGKEGLKQFGGWLDNVAYKSNVTDLRSDLDGKQNLTIYAVNTFGSGSSDGAVALKRAAKYGGFKDKDDDSTYDATVSGICNPVKGEDDLNCDGIPDTYFEASGGSDLKSKIIDAVTDILKSSASGTTVSVLSTSASGEGAIYQAYFYPARVENETDERTWPGFLRGFYLDKFQNLRDDSDSSKPAGAASALVMKKDKIVRMRLDTSDNSVKVDRFKDTFNGDGDPDDSGEGQASDPAWTDMDSVITVWEGGKKLAMKAKSDREIYTWVDKNRNGLQETGDEAFDNAGETLLFTTGNKDILKPYLCAGNAACLASADEAGKIVSFTRGEPVSGYRNRCISVPGGGDDESGCEDTNADSQRSWALGDIVYSTPTLVSGPGEKYDQIYGDAAYRSFKNKYAGRRSVIYAGANDGMLHAFNGGVYKTGDDLVTDDVESGWFMPNSDIGVNGFSNGWSSSIGVGDELWAFVAHDNLPHLAWLACNGTDTDPSVCSNSEYTHVYYVDQRAKVTDARIFPDDATHPGKWGTVLIMGMRLGGGAMDVDTNGDGLATGSEKFRSAYYAFDITDPEQKPKLLWRFAGESGDGLGFTASYPAIVRTGAKGTDGKWFMIVGSGQANGTGTNNRDYGATNTKTDGKVFVVDLQDGSLDRTFTVELSAPSPNTKGVFMGDPIAVDPNLDFNTDTIYIGSNIGGLVSPPSPAEYKMIAGKVYRIRTKGDVDPNNWDSSVLFDPVPSDFNADPDQGKDMGPLLVSPSISKDPNGNLWVFFGTGKLRSQTDMSNSDLQRFYGIKDGCWEKKDGTYTTHLVTVTGNKIASEASPDCPVTYSLGNLLDAGSISVKTATGTSQVEGIGSGGVSYTGNTACTTSSMEGCSLQGTARNANGWFTNMKDPADPLPSEKVLARSVVLGGLVMFTTYKPTSEVCSILGDSTLYALYYETGTAYIKPVLPEGGTYTQSGTEYVSKGLDLGKGMPTAVGVAIGETVSGFVQKSTGEIVRVKTQPGLGVRSGAASWRETTGGGGTTGIEMLYKHIVK